MLIVHTEVEQGDQSGRAKRDMLRHLATVTGFFLQGLAHLPQSRPKQHFISSTGYNLQVTGKNSGSCSLAVTHSHWVFSAFSWERFREVFLTLSHLKVLCSSEEFKQGRS